MGLLDGLFGNARKQGQNAFKNVIMTGASASKNATVQSVARQMVSQPSPSNQTRASQPRPIATPINTSAQSSNKPQSLDLIGATMGWLDGANAQASKFITDRIPPYMNPSSREFDTAFSIFTGIPRTMIQRHAESDVPGPKPVKDVAKAAATSPYDFTVGFGRGAYTDLVEKPVTAGASYVAGAALTGGVGLAGRAGAAVVGSKIVQNSPRLAPAASKIAAAAPLDKLMKGMGAIYAVDVGARVALPDQAPGGMGRRLGGIAATELGPMYLGGRTVQAAMSIPAALRGQFTQVSVKNAVQKQIDGLPKIDLSFVSPKIRGGEPSVSRFDMLSAKGAKVRNDLDSFLMSNADFNYVTPRTRGGEPSFSRVDLASSIVASRAAKVPSQVRGYFDRPYDPYTETMYLKEPDYLSFAGKAYSKGDPLLPRIRSHFDRSYDPYTETMYLKEPDYLSFGHVYQKPKSPLSQKSDDILTLDLTGIDMKNIGSAWDVPPAKANAPRTSPPPTKAAPSSGSGQLTMQKQKDKTLDDVLTLDLTDLDPRTVGGTYGLAPVRPPRPPKTSSREAQLLMTLPKHKAATVDDVMAAPPAVAEKSGRRAISTYAMARENIRKPRLNMASFNTDVAGLDDYIDSGVKRRYATVPASLTDTLPDLLPAVTPRTTPGVTPEIIPEIVTAPVPETAPPVPRLAGRTPTVPSFPSWGWGDPLPGSRRFSRKAAGAWIVGNPVHGIDSFFGLDEAPRQKKKSKNAAANSPADILLAPSQTKKGKPRQARRDPLAAPGKDFFEVKL